MAFKRNEPGCLCCGFGLAASPGDTTIIRLDKGTGDSFLDNSGSVFNVTTAFGAGAVVIGTDPERGRILVQQTDGDIHYVQSKTLTTGLMFDSSTDVGQLDVYYLYYQHSYGVAGGYYIDGSNLVGFTVDTNGTFITNPFTFPTIYKEFLEPQEDSVSVAVDQSGNIYAGVTYNGGLNRLQFLKNGVEHTYLPHDGGSASSIENPLSVLPQFSVYENGNVLNYIYKSTGAEKDNISERAGPGQLLNADIIFSRKDVTGDTGVAEGKIRAFTQYNHDTGRIDFLDLGTWYRITKDLSTSVRLYSQTNTQLIVTHPG